MIKPMNIIDGWKNLFLGLETELARTRADSCTSCEHAKTGTWEKLINDKQIIELSGLKCGVCKCPLAAKLRSTNENCPVGKW